MPPRHHLGQLPLRPPIIPSSCVSRARFLPQTGAAAFSTSAPKKKASTAGVPKKGGSLRLAKKTRPKDTGRRLAPGERKAWRKRIVISNTNALEVPGLRQLDAESVGDSDFQGQVLGIPMESVVDQLRAVEAFKPNQGWGLFRQPAVLMRREAVEMGKLVSSVQANGEKTVRKVIHGERASGKTTLLLQAMAMAFLKGWVVINFPDAQELTLGHTAFAPVEGTSPTQYVQKDNTASLLAQIAKANKTVLENLTLSQKHDLPIPVQENISLDRFAHMGSEDPDIAWPFFQALWKELTQPTNIEKPELTRPPIMFCADNLSFFMNDSKYVDRDAKPIHAHDLLLVRHFTDLLSGVSGLPNGGIVLAATSRSNSPKSLAIDFAIEVSEARAAGAKELPQRNLYKKIDERSMKSMMDIETVKLQGLTQDEARAIMEYYAASGMMRRMVDDNLVSEKWTISGGGIIGELERATVRYKI